MWLGGVSSGPIDLSSSTVDPRGEGGVGWMLCCRATLTSRVSVSHGIGIEEVLPDLSVGSCGFFVVHILSDVRRHTKLLASIAAFEGR